MAYGDHGGQRPGARKRRLENDTLPPEGWQAFRRGWAEQLLANVDGALYICMGTIGTAWVSGPSLAQLRAPATAEYVVPGCNRRARKAAGKVLG